jgi:hypothetical protein
MECAMQLIAIIPRMREKDNRKFAGYSRLDAARRGPTRL